MVDELGLDVVLTGMTVSVHGDDAAVEVCAMGVLLGTLTLDVVVSGNGM